MTSPRQIEANRLAGRGCVGGLYSTALSVIFQIATAGFGCAEAASVQRTEPEFSINTVCGFRSDTLQV